MNDTGTRDALRKDLRSPIHSNRREPSTRAEERLLQTSIRIENRSLYENIAAGDVAPDVVGITDDTSFAPPKRAVNFRYDESKCMFGLARKAGHINLIDKRDAHVGRPCELHDAYPRLDYDLSSVTVAHSGYSVHNVVTIRRKVY